VVRAEAWRGSPTATTKRQFLQLVRILKPSKKRDVFYDVGCGYAQPCIWIADRVKLAVGIENFAPRHREALRRVKRSGIENVRVLKRNVERASYKQATMIYSVITLDLDFFSKVQRETRRGTVIALCYPPPYPIKAKRKGEYFIMETPLKRVRDQSEYAKMFTGRKRAQIGDVYDLLPRTYSKHLEWQISHADSNWKKLGFLTSADCKKWKRRERAQLG